MSEHDEKKLNQDAELAQLRSLVGDARDDGFELDDILAEYSQRSRPKSVVALADEEDEQDNLLIFPTNREPSGQEQRESEEEADREESCPEPVQEQEDSADREDNLLEFPGKKRSIPEVLRSLSQKADDYAEGMFEQEDLPNSAEVRRMEKLIPGVDREENAPRRQRRYRQDPARPDIAPQELARQYGKGLKGLRVRTALIFLLFLPAFYVLLEPVLPIPVIPNPYDPTRPLLTYSIKSWLSAGLLAISILLSTDVLKQTVRRLRELRLGMDTLLLAACLFTLLDAITAPFLLPRQQIGYCAPNILALFLAMQGEHHRRRGLRLACRAAAASAEPYLVTLDEGKWNGRDTYTKHAGVPTGFGSQIQADDGAQRIFRVVCPLIFVVCTVLCLLSCIVAGQPQRLLWSLSAAFTASCALSAPLIFNRPFHKLARRLVQSGGALAGWPGVAQSGRGDGILLTDTDLFPPGAVAFNGVKVFGDWSSERVVAYTATLIRASGSGLDRLFNDLLRTQGGIYRQADRLCCYEGGGLSANIRGDQVLVGSAAFMSLMDVQLPQGLNVRNAVFCAIDGELAGIFALNYSLPDVVFPSVSGLLQEKLAPVLATRDFNIIPAMLRQRFKLAADRMDFPPVERRRELSDSEQEHSPVLTGVLCREGIYPFSETVIAGRRLRRAVRLNAVLACISGGLGGLLACYLTGVGAFGSVSALNLLVYLILWLIPSWLITGWVDQY